MLTSLAPKTRPMQLREDLLDKDSPEGLEIYQLTFAPDLPACHISMEAQVFTPDSRAFIFHCGVGVQSFDAKAPGHRFLLCDVETGEFHPITEERGVTAPSVSPDGLWFYYFVDESTPGAGRILLRRRALAGGGPETLHVLDAPLAGSSFRTSCPNPLSTISSDGRRLAVGVFLGDGLHDGAPYGLLVFDLEHGGEPRLILQGPSWRNVHAQYSRSSDPVHSHDLLIQENHGGLGLAGGTLRRGGTEKGADIHVIRDDGQHLRNLPWGRKEGEWCVGHQCWRGREPWAIGGVISGSRETMVQMCSELHLLESQPVPHFGHEGVQTPGGARNRICRDFPASHFNHFACDLSGRRLVADYRPCWNPSVASADALYLMELGEPGAEAAKEIRYLFSPRSSWLPSAHVHPFFSPDGETLLFNSDESGQTQAYLARGLPTRAG